MKVVSLWSAGKDSCLACYKAKTSGLEVISLFNFTSTDNKNSLSHGLSSEIIRRQAELTEIPILQKPMPQANYREEFKNLISQWKLRKEIKGIVFGDIYLEEHRDWIDKVCRELEIEAIFPLWGTNTRRLVEEFIQFGFEAIVVAIKVDLLGKEWLGRKIEQRFLQELREGIDPCGENGEFHTFVYNGPLFKKPLPFKTGKKILKDKACFLEIIPDENKP